MTTDHKSLCSHCFCRLRPMIQNHFCVTRAPRTTIPLCELVLLFGISWQDYTSLNLHWRENCNGASQCCSFDGFFSESDAIPAWKDRLRLWPRLQLHLPRDNLFWADISIGYQTNEQKVVYFCSISPTRAVPSPSGMTTGHAAPVIDQRL